MDDRTTGIFVCRLFSYMMLNMTRSSEHDKYLAEAQARMDAVLRAKSPQERLAIADGMWRSARKIILHRLKIDHPDWSEDQIAKEAARRLSHGAV